MNKLSFSIIVVGLISAGCSPKPSISFKDNDGNTVSVGGDKTVITGKDGQQGTISTDPNTGAVHIDGTNKDGTKASETIDANNGGAHIEGTDKDGNHVTETIDKNGIAANDGKGNSVQTGANVVTEGDLGLPFYPGSTEGTSGTSMLAKSPEGTTAMSMRTTPDDPSKVMDFYTSKLTNPKPTTTNSNGQIMDVLSGTISDGRTAAIMIQRGTTGNTTVSVQTQPAKKS